MEDFPKSELSVAYRLLFSLSLSLSLSAFIVESETEIRRFYRVLPDYETSFGWLCVGPWSFLLSIRVGFIELWRSLFIYFFFLLQRPITGFYRVFIRHRPIVACRLSRVDCHVGNWLAFYGRFLHHFFFSHCSSFFHSGQFLFRAALRHGAGRLFFSSYLFFCSATLWNLITFQVTPGIIPFNGPLARSLLNRWHDPFQCEEGRGGITILVVVFLFVCLFFFAKARPA